MQMSGCKPRSPGSTVPIIDSEKGNSIPVETEVVHQVDLHTVKFIFFACTSNIDVCICVIEIK